MPWVYFETFKHSKYSHRAYLAENISGFCAAARCISGQGDTGLVSKILKESSKIVNLCFWLFQVVASDGESHGVQLPGYCIRFIIYIFAGGWGVEPHVALQQRPPDAKHTCNLIYRCMMQKSRVADFRAGFRVKSYSVLSVGFSFSLKVENDFNAVAWFDWFVIKVLESYHQPTPWWGHEMLWLLLRLLLLLLRLLLWA